MFSLSDTHNINYLAKVVQIRIINPHHNADNIVCTVIDNSNVIVSKNVKVGDIGIYIPLECTINKDFLSATNSFKNKELNSDKEKSGFFDSSGRVKALTLRGEKSQGYFIPYEEFDKFYCLGVDPADYLGIEFDGVSGREFVKKYTIKTSDLSNKSKQKNKVKIKKESRLIENQFHFHIDTPQLAKNIHRISPNDLITITAKLHGTSAIFSKVFTKKKLTWFENVLQKLKVNIVDTMIFNIYSSRSVVKNQWFEQRIQNNFYDEDIWGIVNSEVKDVIPDQISIYGEIVGYQSNGKPIQSMGGKAYDYGCKVGDHQFYVYRMTFTNTRGTQFEFPSSQIETFCKNNGLKMVPIYYHGYAKDLFPSLKVEQHWQENFLKALEEKYLDKYCSLSTNKVWDEGIVIRKESSLNFDVFKLKSFNFLKSESTELDKASEVDLETSQTA